MIPFDFQPRTRIVFGPDCVDRLGQLTRELVPPFGAQGGSRSASRALVVTDPGIVQAGHTARGLASLTEAGWTAEVFQNVQENPTTDCVDLGVGVAREFRPDVLVGLGGGSSMDTAKGINFLYTNGGRMQDYWGRDKAHSPMLPMIAVPTTAGTGSEAQSFALISDAQTHVKMACGDKKAACVAAVLDPTLTVTQPPKVTALTGIDAMAHALESWVTSVRNPVSAAFSRDAWRWLHANFQQVLANPQDLEARGAMQLGACWAGWAIENSMLGAAHALANPLTAEYGIVHGQAVALMLPHVVRFNAAEVGGLYRELTASTFIGRVPADGGADALADFLTVQTAEAGLAIRLQDLGVEEGRLPQLAVAAAKQWTGGFNPRKVDEPALLALYQQAY